MTPDVNEELRKRLESAIFHLDDAGRSIEAEAVCEVLELLRGSSDGALPSEPAGLDVHELSS